MKNRISKYVKGNKGEKREDVNDIRTFFLACEFKPSAEFWNIIEPFAYNIKPAFIHGNLEAAQVDLPLEAQERSTVRSGSPVSTGSCPSVAWCPSPPRGPSRCRPRARRTWAN